MPNPRISDLIARRQPLRGMHASLVLVVAGFVALVAVSSGTRLIEAIASYRVVHQLLATREAVDALSSAGNLVLRHRTMAQATSAVTSPLFDPVLMRNEADTLLAKVSQRLPELLPAGGNRARQLDEARTAWLAVAAGQESATNRRTELFNAGQSLLHVIEASLRDAISNGISHEGALAPMGEIYLATWQLRMMTAEESAIIASALVNGTTRDPRVDKLLLLSEGRTRLAMDRLMTAADSVGDQQLIALLNELQGSYRKNLRHMLDRARAPDAQHMKLEDFLSQTAPLAQGFVQLKNAIHKAGGRHIEAIRQQRARELLISSGMVLLELALGIGLILLLMRRVQNPLTRLQMALSGADGYFVDWHVPSRVVDYSTGFDIMLGFDPGEIPRTVDGLRWLYHPEDAPQLEAAHRAAYRGDSDRVDAELRIRRKGGGWHWINIRVRVVERDSNGRAVRLIGVVYDANARHQAEDELRRVRHEEEAIFNSSPVAMLIVHDRLIRRSNHAAERMFGEEPGGLDGKPTRILFDTEAEYATVGNKVYEALSKAPNFTYEAEYLRLQYGRFWARVQCSLLDAGTPGLGYVFAFEDISIARRAQLDLDTAVQRQNAMFAALPNGVVILNNRNIVDCNPRFAEMYGYTPAELIGQSTRIFYSSDQDWEERGKLTYPAMSASGTYYGREKVRRRNGVFIDMLVQGCWIDAADPDKGAVFIHTPLNIMLDYPG